MKHAVQLFKYDLSNGMARQMSAGMLGIHLEAIWHTSVCVYGQEFYFDGGVGIACARPRETRFGAPLEVVSFGTTEVDPHVFAGWMRDMGSKYGPMSYNLLQRNCNHFSSDALDFLVGRRVSDDVATMIDRVLATPLGQMLRPALESMTTAPPGSAQLASATGFEDHEPLLSPVGQSDDAVEHRVQELLERLAAWPDPEAAKHALRVVHRVVSNCLDANDPKFGQLNTAGAAFAPVTKVQPALELFHALGFHPGNDAARLILPAGSQKRATFEFAAILISSSID
jgi:hypothetical protein